MLKRSFESVSTMLSKERIDGRPSDAEDLFARNEASEVKKFEVYRADFEDGLRPPCVIISERAEVDDLFATISAYYPVSSPISAFSHMVDPSERALIRGGGKAAKRRGDHELNVLIRALIGAAAGEALLVSAGSSESAATYSVCRRSLSFVLARSLAVYKDGERLRSISERWVSLRRMSNLSIPAHLQDALLLLCGAFESVGSSDEGSLLSAGPPLLSLAGTLGGDARFSAEFRRLLETSFPGLDTQFSELKGSFDGRLSTFTEIASKISRSSATQALKDISLAYVCDQILHGSFAHSGILLKLVKDFPAALVWYGAFAACADGSGQSKVKAVLDKLSRDVTEPFSFESRPQCDISFEELEVVSRAGLRADSLRPSQQRMLLVALAPGVNVYTRQPGDAAAPEGATIDRRQSNAILEATRLLEQAARVLSGSDASSSPADTRLRKRRST